MLFEEVTLQVIVLQCLPFKWLNWILFLYKLITQSVLAVAISQKLVYKTAFTSIIIHYPRFYVCVGLNLPTLMFIYRMNGLLVIKHVTFLFIHWSKPLLHVEIDKRRKFVTYLFTWGNNWLFVCWQPSTHCILTRRIFSLNSGASLVVPTWMSRSRKTAICTLISKIIWKRIQNN